MRSYKCDRCGSYYDKYAYNENDVYIVHGDKKAIDLCPVCTNELSKWYKNEQVQEDIIDCIDCNHCKWIGSPEPIGKCKTCVHGSNFEVSKTFATVLDEYEDLVGDGRWIPVLERLPEEYKSVMVTVNEEIKGEKQYVIYPEARYSKGDGWEWAYESGADYWEKIDGVIAWMPLPEPYKESEETE